MEPPGPDPEDSPVPGPENSPGPDPDDPVADAWPDVLADLEATAEEYADEGWDALALHPGDVTPVVEPGDRVGFDVLLPDGEFEALVEATDGADFDAYEVFTAVRDGAAFAVIATTDPGSTSAVVFPLYYRPGEPTVAELRERATEEGSIRTHLRPLADDRVVTFSHDEPDLLFPA